MPVYTVPDWRLRIKGWVIYRNVSVAAKLQLSPAFYRLSLSTWRGVESPRDTQCLLVWASLRAPPQELHSIMHTTRALCHRSSAPSSVPGHMYNFPLLDPQTSEGHSILHVRCRKVENKLNGLRMKNVSWRIFDPNGLSLAKLVFGACIYGSG